jgi:hypothetical protein
MITKARWVAVGLVAILCTTTIIVAAETTVKLAITDVMKQAHKKPKQLLKKVASGTASDTEKQQLVKLYKVLSQSKPPKGEASSWDAKTKLLVKAAEAAVKGQKDAGQQLARAANCMACHRNHKE